MPYGERWRVLRKIMHAILNKTNMPLFAPFQDVESRNLLWDFLQDPDMWFRATQRYANGVIMGVVFGTRMDMGDEDIKELFETSNELIAALQPGANLVDGWTWLENLPTTLQWWRRRGERLNRENGGGL